MKILLTVLVLVLATVVVAIKIRMKKENRLAGEVDAEKWDEMLRQIGRREVKREELEKFVGSEIYPHWRGIFKKRCNEPTIIGALHTWTDINFKSLYIVTRAVKIVIKANLLSESEKIWDEFMGDDIGRFTVMRQNIRKKIALACMDIIFMALFIVLSISTISNIPNIKRKLIRYKERA